MLVKISKYLSLMCNNSSYSLEHLSYHNEFDREFIGSCIFGLSNTAKKATIHMEQTLFVEILNQFIDAMI